MKNETYLYNPELWLESSIRSLEEYLQRGFDQAIYEIYLGFPAAGEINRRMPFRRTLVHLEIDDIDDRILGFGEVTTDNYNPDTGTVRPQDANEHRIDLDIGAWADDASGGTTARLRAYQILTTLLHGPLATRSLFDATENGDGGLEIIEFNGGRFLVERVDDLPVYRIVNCTLTIRIFSRSPLTISPEETAIQEILQNQNLWIPE